MPRSPTTTSRTRSSSRPPSRCARSATRCGRRILGLLHERAATVTELAAAVKRPKSTVAHHVKVLADAGILRVVRTRRVRAIDERYYGRAARMFYVGLGQAGRRRRPPAGLQRLRGRGEGVRRGVRRRPAAVVHPARPDPGGAGPRVLGRRRAADPRLRPAPPLRRHRLRLHRRPLSDPRLPDAAAAGRGKLSPTGAG